MFRCDVCNDAPGCGLCDLMRHKFDEDAHANAFQLTFNFKVSTQNFNISNFQQNNLHLSI